MIRSQFCSFFQFFIYQVRHNDLTGSSGFTGKHCDKAYGSGSQNHHRFANLYISLSGCMESYGEGLDQRAFFGGNIVRQLKAHIRRKFHELLITTLNRRRCKKYHIRAKVVFAGLTELALATGNARL